MVNTKRVPAFLIRLYLNCPAFWRFAGKQFLVVAEKVASNEAAPSVRK
jgi:hypothetical protein